MFVLLATTASAQCSGYPPIIKEEDCENYPVLTDNENVNSGQTFAICGNSPAPTTVRGLNLNGGIVRICANATITGNLNSGTIVVSCGATLTFPNSQILNQGVGIINYGTVVVHGNLELQNMNNYFYNASPDAQLQVDGNMLFAVNSNQANYFWNEGFAKIDGNIFAYDGARVCIGEGSVITCKSFYYIRNCGGAANNFRYNGNSGAGTLRFSETATIKADLTSSNNIHVWGGPGSIPSFSGCGSWGNAVFVPNAPPIPTPVQPAPSACDPQNCYTRQFDLPIVLLSFEAIPDVDKVQIIWSTANEQNNDYFTVLRSADAENWETIEVLPGAGNSSSVQKYQITDRNPIVGMSYYQLKQTDKGGEATLSDIVTAKVAGLQYPRLRVYQEFGSGLVHVSGIRENGDLQIFDISGNNLTQNTHIESRSGSAVIDPSNLPAGIYVVRSENGAGKFCKTYGN